MSCGTMNSRFPCSALTPAGSVAGVRRCRGRTVRTGGVRRLRTRDQFLALLYGQFSGAASLREIEYGLASQAARLYHAGLRGVSRSTSFRTPTRSGLSNADRLRRDGAVWRGPGCGASCAARCVCSMRPRSTCRGCRVDLGAVLRGPVARPSSTSRKRPAWRGAAARRSHARQGQRHHRPAKAMPIEPGAIYVFDLAYYSYDWWAARFTARAPLRHPPEEELAGEQSSRCAELAPDGPVLAVDRSGGCRTGASRQPQDRPSPAAGPRSSPWSPQRPPDRPGATTWTPRTRKSPALQAARQIELFFKWIKQPQDQTPASGSAKTP